MLKFYDNYYFLFALLFSLGSIYYFVKQSFNFAIGLLIVASLFLGYFLIQLDPFLNLWDEQYHALVAKNLIGNWLTPILAKDDILKVVSAWGYKDIWLHKQPLFLWEMAISIKIFGINEIAVRIPSMIKISLMPFLIYQIGTIMFNKNVGYFSSFFFVWSYFISDYLTGYYPTDHNDIAFLFYSTCSLWALTCYFNKPSLLFALLTGLFVGLAILCKWLTALLPYLVWIIVLFADKFKKNENLKMKDLLFSLSVCSIVFLPWQLYCYFEFREEFIQSMAFNKSHIFQALEGHSGDIFFYYFALHEYFGDGLVMPILILLIYFFTMFQIKSIPQKLLLSLYSLGFIVFFSFVKTKMLGYIITVYPIFIISIGYYVFTLLNYLKNKINYKFGSVLSLLVIVLICYGLFNPSKLYKHHSNYENGRRLTRFDEQTEMIFFDAINKIKNNKIAVFNFNKTLNSYISGRFYTNCLFYEFKPTEEQKNKLFAAGYKVIVL